MIIIDGISLQINSFELFQWHKLLYVFPVVYLVIIELKEKMDNPRYFESPQDKKVIFNILLTSSEKVLDV